MKRVALTGPALDDIDKITRSSVRDFGPDAARRYEALIDAALDAIAANENNVCVRRSAETNGVFWYHLRSARMLVAPDDRVRRPRHILLFRIQQEVIVVLRVLNDAMELTAHLR